MLNLFNILDNNDKELIDLLKINKIYKTKFVYDNLTTEILELRELNIEYINNIKIIKRIEIANDYYDNEILSKFNKILDELKIKEFYVNIYSDYNDEYFITTNKYLKKLIILKTNIILIQNNLTFLSLRYCKIKNINNFRTLINLLNNTSQNLKTLFLHNICFNEADFEELNDIDYNESNIKINYKSKTNNKVKINISDNKIKLLNLKHLTITNIHFSHINLKSLTNLEYLAVKCANDLNKIDGLSKLTKLTNLCLESNNLYNINLDRLIKLKELRLHNNYLNHIDGLSKLINLTSLYLSKNNLKKVDIKNLTNLKYLNLSFNILEEIDIKSLINLINLNLQNNHIEKISLNNLTNLKGLNLSTNNIFDIKNIEYSNLTNLTYLNLNNNYLNNVDLSNFYKLEFLELENTKLDQIDINNLVNLKKLNLSKNYLKTIDLTNLNKIHRLDLSHNKLIQLDIKNSIKLMHLDIQNNFIKEIYIDSSKINNKCIVKYENFYLRINNLSGFKSNKIDLSDL